MRTDLDLHLQPPPLGTSTWRRILPELNVVYEKDLQSALLVLSAGTSFSRRGETATLTLEPRCADEHGEHSLPHPARHPEQYKLQRLRPY